MQQVKGQSPTPSMVYPGHPDQWPQSVLGVETRPSRRRSPWLSEASVWLCRTHGLPAQSRPEPPGPAAPWRLGAPGKREGLWVLIPLQEPATTGSSSSVGAETPSPWQEGSICTEPGRGAQEATPFPAGGSSISQGGSPYSLRMAFPRTRLAAPPGLCKSHNSAVPGINRGFFEPVSGVWWAAPFLVGSLQEEIGSSGPKGS